MMTPPETTNDDSGKLALTPQQSAAADLLAAGASVTDAAASIGVARQTVSGWLHGDRVFQAALNRRREELWSRVTDRLRALLPEGNRGPRSRDGPRHRVGVRCLARHPGVRPLREGAADRIE